VVNSGDEVATPLLTTKLNIPLARPQLVNRPRLIERLQEGLNYNFVLISAPAGFGKTTLLSEWARQNQPQISTTWLSLDAGDNDPVRFWDYFIAAMKTLQPDIGESTLSLLHSPQPPSTEPMFTLLINDISSILGDFVVVLDDYHFVESPQVQDGITYLLEHMPVQMHLVIASRADPPLPLAHFRGKEMMLEIRTDDLRFTLDEVTKLLNELTTPELSSEDIAALNERTEGWAVGLKMAALSISGQKDISAFIAAFTGSQRYVMDYLMEEVLQKQTQGVRDFLMKTSVLERLSAPLCDAITERQDSQDILLELERGHLFIVPLDESRQWYRYEHLFADLLRHQCETVHGTEQVIALHRQASQWYEDNNRPDEAIHHALLAKDWETSMRLIYARCEELRKRGQFDTLLSWLQVIPEEILRTHHRLYSQYASYLTVVSQFDAAEAALSYLANEVHDDADIQGEAAFSLSNIARMRGDFPRSIDMAEKALSILPPGNIAMRARANWNLGYVLYDSGRFREAEVRLTDAYKLGQQAKDFLATDAAMMVLGGIAYFSSRLRRAIDMLERALEARGQVGGSSRVLLSLSRVFYELNDLEKAAEDARLSIERSELGGIVEGRLMPYFFQARIHLARGDEAGAVAAMAKMDETSRHPTVSVAARAAHAACRTLFSIRQNDLEAATEWGRKLAEYPDILHLQYHYILARLLIAQGKKDEAAEYSRDLYERLVKVEAHGLAIGARVCQALAADTEEAALEFLTDALIKGEPEGFIRSFVDEGKLITPLLEKALSMGVTPEYTRKLIDIIETEERQKLKMKKVEGAPSLYHALLSERELEVLRLMAEGMSNQRIADRLIISLGTTKNHVHNILEKLNAEGRTQAVAQARELELI